MASTTTQNTVLGKADDLAVDQAGASASLSAETGKKITSAWLLASGMNNRAVAVGKNFASGQALSVAFQQATDASGTGAKAVTPAAPNGSAASATATSTATTDVLMAMAEISAGALDQAGGFQYIQAVTSTAATAGGEVASASLLRKRQRTDLGATFA